MDRRSKKEEDVPPPSYHSIFAPGGADRDVEAGHRSGGIPSPGTYEPPSSFGGNSTPHIELVRGAAHSVTRPRMSYVEDDSMTKVGEEDKPMVAQPPLSDSWHNTVHGVRGRNLSPHEYHETSFSTPEPHTVTIGGPKDCPDIPSHRGGPIVNGSHPIPVTGGATSPAHSQPEEGTAGMPRNLDVYNANESPDHHPNYPASAKAAEVGGIHVRLSREDEEDVDNGNAPELEHIRHSAANVTAGAEVQTQQPSCLDAFRQTCSVWCERKSTRKLIIVLSVVLPCLLMFLLIFPISFIYVDHYQLALKRTKSTGFVDTTTVYYPGCYVLGPDMEFRYFIRSANVVHFNKIEVTTVDRLTFTMSLSFQYYLIPDKIGNLYDMFELDYDSVIRTVAVSSIKNECVKFSFDKFKSDRTFIEKHFHKVLKRRFTGDCHLAEMAGRSSCNQAYHINVRYFQLGMFHTPDALMERLLQRSIAHELTETEKFNMESAVVEKETERQVKSIENSATEILNNATAQASYIKTVAHANADVLTTMAHIEGLKQMCANLSITRNDHKMSMYYIDTIKHSNHIRIIPDVTYRSLWTHHT